MNIKINRSSQTPLYLQIKCSVQNLILSGEIEQGYKMPAERKLAEELALHRNTVIKAYSELVDEGYLIVSSKAPKGYFVKEATEGGVPFNRFFPLEKMIRYHFNEKEKLFLDIFSRSEHESYLSLGGIIMDESAYPTDGIAEIVRDMVHAPKHEAARMKRNICAVLLKENMYVSPKNIQLVSETNQALNHIMTLYLKPGDYVVAEEPVVPDNASIFRNKGIHLVTVPMEADGMDMLLLEATIKKYAPKFIYTMPNFHNPTGIVMSLKKRKQLLELAGKYCIPIIEEDSQRDFRYTGSKFPTLYSQDRYRSVLYIDSFTLAFSYGIKTGYIVGPTDLIETLGRLIVVDETSVSSLGQYMLNEYIERGYFDGHISRLVAHYARKLDLLCQCLDKIADKGIRYTKPTGGLLLWCPLDERINERRLFQETEKRGLLIVPGFLFYPNGYKGGGHIRLCFSNISDADIEIAIKILGEALELSAEKATEGSNESARSV